MADKDAIDKIAKGFRDAERKHARVGVAVVHTVDDDVPGDEKGKAMSDRVTVWNTLGAALADLNGLNHLEPASVQIRYLPEDKHLKVFHHLVADGDMTADYQRDLAAFYDEEEKLEMHQYRTVWQAKGDNELQKNSFSHQLSISVRTILALAALNLAICGGNAYIALSVGYALALGLVNVGGDGYTKEWVSVAYPPSVADVRKILVAFNDAERNPQFFADVIAFTGYRRITRTHIYTSSDARGENAGGAIDAAVIYRMAQTANLKMEPIPPPQYASVLYNACHAYSMGGSIGFYNWWRASDRAGPLMQKRGAPLGDLWKPVALTLAGYNNLKFLPVVGEALQRYAAHAQTLEDMITQLAADGAWHSTSSLGPLIDGQPTFKCPKSFFILMMSAMIAGAAKAKFLPDSIRRAYYISRIATEQSALVATWESLFSSYDQRLRSTTIATIIGRIGVAAQQKIAAAPNQAQIQEVPAEEKKEEDAAAGGGADNPKV